MTIYIITHKSIDLVDMDNYQKLLVGANFSKINSNNFVLDNTGEDNISYKNKNYCELTGLYWIWKHDHSNVKGLVHYRRFFTRNRFSSNHHFFYNSQDIKNILSQYDVIVAEKLFVSEKNIINNYKQNHHINDWTNLKKIVKNDYPEYLLSFEKMEASNTFYPYNMMISDSDIFNSYCQWLFEVLEKLENITDLSNYTTHQARIYGFISERLLGVWLETHNLKVYEAPVIQLDSRYRYRFRRGIEKVLQKKIK